VIQAANPLSRRDHCLPRTLPAENAACRERLLAPGTLSPARTGTDHATR